MGSQINRQRLLRFRNENEEEHFGKIFSFTKGTGTGDEVVTQEEDQDKREIDGSESQVSLSSSTHENEAPADTENGYSDQFGSVRTINKTMDGLQQSRKFMTMANSDIQSGKFRVTGSGTTLGELEAYY